MKRIILLIIAFFMMVLCSVAGGVILSGCSNKDDNSNEIGGNATSGYRIYFDLNYDNIPVNYFDPYYVEDMTALPYYNTSYQTASIRTTSDVYIQITSYSGGTISKVQNTASTGTVLTASNSVNYSSTSLANYGMGFTISGQNYASTGRLTKSISMLYGCMPSTGTYYVSAQLITNYSGGALSCYMTNFSVTKSATTVLSPCARTCITGPGISYTLQQSGDKTATVTLPKPTRAGYKFAGWYTSRIGGELVTDSFFVASSRTVYAHWVENNGNATLPTSTKITAYRNSGTETLPRTNQISNISLSYYGYGFAINSNGYLESQNAGVNNSYSMVCIRFSAKASSTFTIQYISYGESNYDYAIFSNLDQALSESYSADTTYYKRTYGEASSAVKTLTYSGISSGSHEIYIKFRKDGSTHSYNDSLQLWFGNDWFSGTTTAEPYKVHFVGMRYGALPTMSRTGYTFNGWYTAETGGTQITESSIYNGSNIYAHWSTNSYTVSFAANGGSGTMSNQTWSYDSWYSVTNGFTRTGYVFSGWSISTGSSITHYYGSSTSSYSTTSSSTFTDSNTGIRYYKNLRSTSGTVTFTAQWTVKSYTLYLDANGGSSTRSFGVSYGTSSYSNISSYLPTRTGYTFLGFTNSPSGGTYVYDANGAYTGNYVSGWGNYLYSSGTLVFDGTNGQYIYIYAQWTQNTYTITFKSIGVDTTLSYTSTTVTYGSTYGSLPTATQTSVGNGGLYFDKYVIDYFPYEDFVENTGCNSSGSYITGKTGYYSHPDLIPFKNTSGAAVQLYLNYSSNATVYCFNSSNSLLAASTSSNSYFSIPNGTTGIRIQMSNSNMPYQFRSSGTAYCLSQPITSTSTVNWARNHTVIATWKPISVTITIKYRVINANGTYSNVDNSEGGTCTVSRHEVSNDKTNWVSGERQTEASKTYTVQQGKQVILNKFEPKDGYAYVGVSDSATPSSSIITPSSKPSTTSQRDRYPKSNLTTYVYFKKLSDNRLQYDETDKYFYFEDGYYPQSEASISSGTATGESIRYNDGKNEISIPIYTNGGNRYARVIKNGVTKWFKFEPIRWRVSDYGVAKTEKNIARYTTLYNLRNFTSYASNFTAVSDLILGVGAMHNTREIDENSKYNGQLSGTWNRDMVGYKAIENTTNGVTLNFNYSAGTSQIDVERYGCSEIGEGSTVKNCVDDFGYSVAYNSPLRIVSQKELEAVGFVNKQARASDMVAFILGLDKNQVSYWTRDLSNLGAGVAITPTGTQVRPWLDEVLGMRFAYTFREGSSAF